jgi:hypothetical protein
MKIFTIVLIFFLSAPCMLSAMQNQNFNVENAKKWAQAGLGFCVPAYLTVGSLTLCHEFGHWIANKTLLKQHGFIGINPLMPVDGFFIATKKPAVTLLKEFMQKSDKKSPMRFINYVGDNCVMPGIGIRSALVSVAGPIFGFVGSLGILKGLNIVDEYRKNNHNLKHAIKDGIKKPLFNKDQNWIIQSCVALNILIEYANLVPTCKYSDGGRIIDALKMSHLFKKSSYFMKTCGYASATFLAGTLGFSLLKAHFFTN